MRFARRRNRLTTHFSERMPVVKRRITLLYTFLASVNTQIQFITTCNTGTYQYASYCYMFRQVHVATIME